MTYILNDWQNLENVNYNNLQNNTFNLSKLISYYFPKVPAICNGLGTVSNKFGQVGTSNVFNIASGAIRLVNRKIGTTPSALTFSEVASNSMTITGVSTLEKYVCLEAKLVQIDTYTYSITNIPLYAAQTLAQLQANSLLLPMFVISESGGIYTVSTDSNCAHNYNS